MNSDIEVEIGAGARPGEYVVRVVHAVAGGEATGTLNLDVDELLSRREQFEQAVLSSSVQARRMVPVAEQQVRQLGLALFEALFAGRVSGAYRACLGAAQGRDQELRLVLRLTAPELAVLPWEAMFDPETETYLCRREPLVRHVPAPYTLDPLEVNRPLRILGVAASPRGLPWLDVEAEQQHLTEALAQPLASRIVELEWVSEATWDGVHGRLLAEPWHVVHFVGHGDFDLGIDEGVIALVGEDGRADLVEASRLADLLSEARPTPRLVVLNSCSSGKAGTDLFSGTAAALVHSGIHAVAAMQFTISDKAAIRFARGFYTALAEGRGIDEAARSGRIAILGLSPDTLEWLTPVLYLRGNATHLFNFTEPTTSPARVPGLKPADAPTAAPDRMPQSPTAETPAAHKPRLIRRAAVTAVIAGFAVIGLIAANYLFRGAPRTHGNLPAWTTGGPVYSRPYVDNNAVYVGSEDHKLYAFNAETGAVRWTYTTRAAIYSSPIVFNGVVYIGSTDDNVYALRASNGSRAWTRPYNTRAAIYSSPVVDNSDGILYIGSNTGNLYALKAKTGSLAWHHPYRTEARIESSPVVDDQRGIVYACNDDGHVYALNAADGRPIWPHYFSTGIVGYCSVAEDPSDGMLYVANSDGYVYKLNPNGKLRWADATRYAIHSSPVVGTDGTVYVGNSGGYVYALKPSGKKLWVYRTGGSINDSGPTIANYVVYIGSGDGDVYALNVYSTKRFRLRWTHHTRGDVESTPRVDNGIVYVGSNDDKVYALTAFSG